MLNTGPSESVKKAAHPRPPPTPAAPKIDFSQPPAYDNPFPNPFAPFPSTFSPANVTPGAYPSSSLSFPTTTPSSAPVVSAPMTASTWPEPTPSLSISALQPPRLYVPAPTLSVDDGLQGSFGQPRFSKDGNVGQFEFNSKPLSFYVDDGMAGNPRDQALLYHFVDYVLPMIFPILDMHREGPGRAPEILTAMEENESYYFSCLSVSALHMKTSTNVDQVTIDREIMLHRFRAISLLTDQMHDDNAHSKVLNSMLALILFYCSVGETDDYLPDIPWTEHIESIGSLVQKLGLLNYLPRSFPPLSLTLATWVDILGGTMMGQAPQLSHEYRDRHIQGQSIGLKELMGCEDRVMFLISEIACLEGLKKQRTLSHWDMRHHIGALRAQIDHAEPADKTLRNPCSATGVVNWDILTKNMTTMFRVAARIYLYSLEPGFDHSTPEITSLVTIIAETLRFIPTGPFGFDRSLAWPLFIAGAYSTPYCAFRDILAQRSIALGRSRASGSFGRMYRILEEVWRLSDQPAPAPAFPDSGVHLPYPGVLPSQPAAPNVSTANFPSSTPYLDSLGINQAQPAVTSADQPSFPLPSMYLPPPNDQPQLPTTNPMSQPFQNSGLYLPSPVPNQSATLPSDHVPYMDTMRGPNKSQLVHWRDVMKHNNWLYLII